MKILAPFAQPTQSRYLLPVALTAAAGMGWLTGREGVLVPALLLTVLLAASLVGLIFIRPRIGLIAYIVYCLVFGFISRHTNTGVPLGLGIDIILVITWLAVIFSRSPLRWATLQTDLCALALGWFFVNVIELVNPAGASVAGWFYEMRSTTLYWLLTVPLAYLVFNKPRDLRLFFLLVIGFSVVGALYGIKQKVLGVDASELQWLNNGQAKTHLIWGKLRVFSFYAEAAQFGASQAHLGVVCLILALGPFQWWKRGLLGITSLLLFYGMLISGTRGALFVVAAGLLIYLALSKQTKVLVLGTMLVLGSFAVLKYTSLGSSNGDVVRLRSSLDPQDPSFQARLNNQSTLRNYLAQRPFGEGVGTIGAWGHQFNSDKYISTIEPDSYYVKVWAEYGIVGFVIWFGMMLYILGKCCGIVWNIQNPQLRQKLMALTAGFAGILVSSYGNEVMNQIPSSMIVYLSWVFVFLGPEFDKHITAVNELSGE